MFTKEELGFIYNLLAHIQWKTGQSESVKIAEDICKKIKDDVSDEEN